MKRAALLCLLVACSPPGSGGDAPEVDAGPRACEVDDDCEVAPWLCPRCLAGQCAAVECATDAGVDAGETDAGDEPDAGDRAGFDGGLPVHPDGYVDTRGLDWGTCTGWTDAAICERVERDFGLECGTVLLPTCFGDVLTNCGCGRGQPCRPDRTCDCRATVTDAEECDARGAECGLADVLDSCGRVHHRADCGGCPGSLVCREANDCWDPCDAAIQDAAACAAAGLECGHKVRVGDTCYTCGQCSGSERCVEATHTCETP